MPRKKKENTEEKKELSQEERIAQAKEKRKKAWEEKQKQDGSEERIRREEFRRFFVRIKGKLKIGKEMEEILWLHLKASGFDTKDKFEKGIKHFGYKL